MALSEKDKRLPSPTFRARRRLHDQMQRRGKPVAFALAIWLLWALVSVLSARFFRDGGLLFALLLLSGVTCLGGTYALLWLRRDLRQERQREAERARDLMWLSGTIAPRRPLPLWAGGMARVELLDALWQLIRESGPRLVVEAGSGISTLIISYALEAGGGRLVSLEDNTIHAEKTRRMLSEHGFAERSLVLDAPLRRLELEGEIYYWYDCEGLIPAAPIDLLLVDGPAGYLAPLARYPVLPVLRGQLAEGALILVDDTDRQGEVRIIKTWLAKYPELQRDEKLSRAGFSVLRLSDVSEWTTKANGE